MVLNENQQTNAAGLDSNLRVSNNRQLFRFQTPTSFRFFLLLMLLCVVAAGALCAVLFAIFAWCDVIKSDGCQSILAASAINGPKMTALCGVGAVFWGFGSVSLILRLKRIPGWIEIGPENLALACYSLGPVSGFLGGYFCAGVSEWKNVADSGVKRAFFARCLGLSFVDVRQFADSYASVQDHQAVISAKWGERWNGIMLAAFTQTPIVGSVLDLVMKLFGYSGMPKSSDAVDILEWNRKNWGYHILIVTNLIPSVSEIVGLIRKLSKPSDLTALSGHAQRSIEERLKELNEIFQQRLISPADFEQTRQRILSEL